MKKIIKKILLFDIIILIGIFFLVNYAFAMPKGTLLYRTSENNKLYGYNTNELFKVHLFEKQKIELNCGHVGIYIGKEDDGVEYVVEAVNNGIQKTPVKYFVNKGVDEKLIGAKIPNNITDKQKKKIAFLAEKLSEKNLKYDFDFRTQKGPNSKQFICVGLTEKLYESANAKNIEHLAYNPNNYAINITPDGYDDSSIYNTKTNDVFSTNLEYSKISKRASMGEIVGTNCGKEYNNERYFFLPYTQFLQPSLKDVKVDIQVSSDFSGDKIRGLAPVSKIILSWTKNNTVSSSKIVVNKVKEAGIKTKNKFVNSWSKVVKSYKKLTLFSSLPNNTQQDDKIILQDKKDETKKEELNKIDDIEIKVLSATKEVKVEKNNKKNLIKPKILKPKLKSIKAKKKNKLSIKYVIDGDTFVLSTGEKVRYIGVDTPELKKPGPKDDECLAWVARIRNMQLLGSGDLKLVKDPSSDKDKYGRLLRYVYAGDIFVNERLALEGMAEEFFCKPGWKNCPVAVSVEHINKIKKSAKSARENKRGIYSSVCDIVKTTKLENKNKIIQPKIEKVKKPVSTFFLGSGGGLSLRDKEKEDNNKILEIKISEQETSTNTVDVFKLFDLKTNSNNYTASITVGVIIGMNKTPDAFYIGNNDDRPATTSDQWQTNLPENYILDSNDGLKNINLWLKYGEKIIFGTSTEIILDQKPPIIKIIPKQSKYHNASSSSFVLSVDEDILEFQYKFNYKNWDIATSGIEISGNFDEGNNTIFVEALDLSGNFASSSYEWIIDMTAPSSTMDILPEQIASTTFLISWSGEDEIGIESYDVQYRINNDWIDIASSTTATSTIFNIDIATTTVYFRVRAIDKAGNIENWPISEQGDTSTKIIHEQLELTDGLQYLWHFDEVFDEHQTFDSIKSAMIENAYIYENGKFNKCVYFFKDNNNNNNNFDDFDTEELTFSFYWNASKIYKDKNFVNAEYISSFDFDNDWHHIAIVDNKKYLALYLDGVEIFFKQGDFNTNDNVLNNINFYNNTQMDGSYIMTMFMIVGHAYIDELTIWDRALSPDEVKILSNMTTQFYPDNN